MTKTCPKCGKQLPEDAKFCMDCGYSMDNNQSKSNSNFFSNGSIFIVLIAVVLVIGGIFIVSSTFSGGNHSSTNQAADNVEHVDLTISDVSGWHNEGDDGSKESYSFYTDAIFNSVPNDLKGYNIKTTYYDSNDTEIGHETEKLENVYYDSDYAISFGFYTTYKLPDPDHVKVEIIKGGKVIDTYTENIDRNSIDFLN